MLKLVNEERDISFRIDGMDESRIRAQIMALTDGKNAPSEESIKRLLNKEVNEIHGYHIVEEKRGRKLGTKIKRKFGNMETKDQETSGAPASKGYQKSIISYLEARQKSASCIDGLIVNWPKKGDLEANVILEMAKKDGISRDELKERFNVTNTKEINILVGIPRYRNLNVMEYRHPTRGTVYQLTSAKGRILKEEEVKENIR